MIIHTAIFCYRKNYIICNHRFQNPFNIDYSIEVLYPLHMKTWITYIAALLMGLATALLFGSSPYASGLLSSVSSFLVSLGVFITIPILFITFSHGISSLGKDAKGKRMFFPSLLWAVVSTAVLALAASLVFILKPEPFPVTSTAGSSPGTLISHVSYMLSSAGNAMYPLNAFWSIASATRFIVPVIIVAWILGLAMKPSADIIRPAYTTMNSFSEVMYRISRTYTVYGFFLVYASSSSFFVTMYQEKTILAVPEFAKMLAAAIAVAVLIVIPLLYAVFTGFRKNPYRIIYRSIAPALMGFSTSNIIATLPLCESTSRQNLGVQKRIAATAAPVLSVIAKGGSTFISVLSLLSLFQATTGSMPNAKVIAAAAACAAIVSFISSAAAGTETVLITVLTLEMLGINLYGAENALIAFVPLVGGIATMLDAIIINCGNSIASVFVGTDTEVPYKDTI